MNRARLRTTGIAVVLAAAVTTAVIGQPVAAASHNSATPARAASAPPSSGASVPPAGVSRARAHAAPRSAHSVPNPLLKEQFASQGNDDGGDSPALSALCQSFLGHPNPYGPLAPNVDVIVGDQTVPTGSQTGCSTAQNETTVAVNPYNPRNIVAGANDYRVYNSREGRNDSSGWAYTSLDGGRTWTNVELPKLDFQTGGVGALSYMDGAGDPSIAFGPGNTVYYSTLVYSRAAVPASQQSASGILVSVSHDSGLHWGDPAILHVDGVTANGTPTPTSIFNDKEWIAADPFSGKAYVAWTQFTYDAAGNFLESPVVSVASTDFGQTWTQPTRISPSLTGFTGGITPFGSGANPQIANDGTLYVAYETSVCATVACNAPTDHDAVVLATSRDGGRTFRNSEVSLDFDFPISPDVNNNALTGENFRINSFPQLAYDRLTNHLWVTWADDRNGQYAGGQSVKTNGDVFLADAEAGNAGPDNPGADNPGADNARTGRNGSDPAWSKPVRIGTGSDEVFPAVAVVAGRVAVSYYTRAYDPNGIGLDFAYSAGWGRSVANAPVQRITTQTANPQVQFVGIGAVSGKVLQGTFIGDYTAVAVGLDFRIHPVWTDFRGNPGTTDPNQDVATQSIPILP